MLKKVLTAVAAVLLAVPASAGELDLLLEKLVEKNVVTGGEAQEIRVGTQEQVKSEISRGLNMTLPLWMQVMKFKADLRLRYQYNDNQNNAYTQHRGRYRLRFGADTMISEQFYIGFGLASGSSADSRSTNQTLTKNFEKKNIYVDYAYAEYTANDYLSLAAGRVKLPVWSPTDMLWDTDINPEGVSARFGYKPDSMKEYFMTGGFFSLNEDAANAQDPYLAFVQPGFSYMTEDTTLDFKAAAAYYAFGHVRGAAELANRSSVADGYQKANTLSGTKYKYNYDAVNPGLEINYTLLDPIILPLFNISYGGVFGEYIKNTTGATDGEGWIAGARIGQRKVEEAGQVQLRWALRRLGRNAWLDTYPDSDFYGGSAGVRGQEWLLSYGLARNVVLETDYYLAKSLVTGKKEKLFQLDLNFKF